MTDLMEGLKEYLSQDATVSTLTQGKIYEPELDAAEDINMQMDQVIVLRPGGGPAGPRQLQLNDRRIVVQCYAPTGHLAMTLNDAVYDALKTMEPGVWKSTYIHWCNLAAGPTEQRDITTQWPFVQSIWLARASDLTIA